MIDLNVRLDSSLTDDEYGLLARSQGIDVKETFPECRSFNFKNASLEDYLNVRQFALSLLQNEEAIEFAVKSLVHRLFHAGYFYFEIALTPFLHKEGGLSQRKIVKAALVGLNDALMKCPGIDGNLVLYCHRDASEDYNTETCRLALEYRDERIVAVGLEGDDKNHPIGEYEKLFARCKKVNYPVVIELGKHYNSNNSILKAAQIGAKRIVSPYKVDLSIQTFQIIKEKGVYFEFTPSLDIVKGFLKDYESFEIKKFWQRGYDFFVSGSSYTILNASLKDEFIHLGQHSAFTRDDVYHSLYISIQAAFTRNLRERNRILKGVIDSFNDFYNKTI
ncbi:MAG: hypothetical protein K5906_02110 [Bacilli bacterium]|nr:hypothetical protein [Bacilli bacterium]